MNRRFGLGLSHLPETLAVVLPLLVSAWLWSGANRLPTGWCALGFVHVDQPVYYAAARELYENGNGVFYASPYSSNPASPRLYTHLYPIVCGVLWKAGLSFTAIDYLMRWIAGSGFLLLAVALQRRAFGADPMGWWAALAAAVCSGMAWLVAACHTAVLLADPQNGRPGAGVLDWLWHVYVANFHANEGGYAEWHQSLLRNVTYAPEAFYHVLFLACALSCLAQRRALAVMFQCLAWWAHPFTGLEIGVILALFWTVEWILGSRMHAKAAAAAWGVNALFALYNMVFLGMWDEHASVAQTMRSFGNPILLRMLLPAYGLFVPLSVFYLASEHFRNAWRTDQAARFFTVWLVSVAGLVFHDRVAGLVGAAPFQAMHFTHGYLFVPLVFFAFRWTGLAAAKLRQGAAWQSARLLVARALPAVVIACHLPDDPLWFFQLRQSLATELSPYATTAANLELLRQIDTIPGTLTFHAVALPSEYADFQALVPVLTHHRALLPHAFNTPFLQEKRELAEQIDRSFDPEALCRARVTALAIDSGTWQRLRESPHAGRFELLLTCGPVHVVRFFLIPHHEKVGQLQEAGLGRLFDLNMIGRQLFDCSRRRG